MLARKVIDIVSQRLADRYRGIARQNGRRRTDAQQVSAIELSAGRHVVQALVQLSLGFLSTLIGSLFGSQRRSVD